MGKAVSRTISEIGIRVHRTLTYLESRTDPQADGATVLFDRGRFEEESYLDEIEVA